MDIEMDSVISDTTMGTNLSPSPQLLSSLSMLRKHPNITESPAVDNSGLSVLSSPMIPMLSQKEKYRLEKFLDEQSDNDTLQLENTQSSDNQTSQKHPELFSAGSINFELGIRKNVKAYTIVNSTENHSSADVFNGKQVSSKSSSDDGDERSQSLLPQTLPSWNTLAGFRLGKAVSESTGLGHPFGNNVTENDQRNLEQSSTSCWSKKLLLPESKKSSRSSGSSGSNNSLDISISELEGRECDTFEKIRNLHTHIEAKLKELTIGSSQRNTDKVSRYKDNLSSLQPLLTKINETHKLHRKCLLDKFQSQTNTKTSRYELKEELHSLEERQKALLKLFQKHKELGIKIKQLVERTEDDPCPIINTQMQLFSQLTSSGSEVQQSQLFSQQTACSSEIKDLAKVSSSETLLIARIGPPTKVPRSSAPNINNSDHLVQSNNDLKQIDKPQNADISKEKEKANFSVSKTCQLDKTRNTDALGEGGNIDTSFSSFKTLQNKEEQRMVSSDTTMTTTKRKADIISCTVPKKITSTEIADESIHITDCENISPKKKLQNLLPSVNVSVPLCVKKVPNLIPSVNVSVPLCNKAEEFTSPTTVAARVAPLTKRKTFLSPIASTTDTSDIFPVKCKVLSQRLNQKFAKERNEHIVEDTNKGRKLMAEQSNTVTTKSLNEVDKSSFMLPRKKYPSLKMLIDSKHIEAGVNNISLSANGREYPASLGQDGVIVTSTGGRFKTPMGWLSYITEGKMFKRVTAYKRVHYRGKPLSSFVVLGSQGNYPKVVEEEPPSYSPKLLTSEKYPDVEVAPENLNEQFTVMDISAEKLGLMCSRNSIPTESSLFELTLNYRIKLISNNELTDGHELPDGFWNKPYRDIVFGDQFMNEVFE